MYYFICYCSAEVLGFIYYVIAKRSYIFKIFNSISVTIIRRKEKIDVTREPNSINCIVNIILSTLLTTTKVF